MKTNKRRGFSIIELSTVIGVSTVIAGMAVWLVHASMQKSRDGQRYLAAQNTISRLAETFRRDVHAAATIVEKTAEKQGDAGDATRSTWILNLAGGGAVRYRLEPGRLIRSEFTSIPAGKADSTKAISRESFELPSGIKISIQLEPPSQPRIASLLLSPAGTGGKSRDVSTKPRIHPLRIDAAVSTDTRFDKVTTRNNKKFAMLKETKK